MKATDASTTTALAASGAVISSDSSAHPSNTATTGLT